MATSMTRPTDHKGDEISSNDPVETIRAVSAILSPHRMEVRSKGRLHTRLRSYALGPVSIADVSYGSDIRIRPDPGGDYILVHTSQTGQGEISVDGRRYPTNSDSIIVTTAQQRVEVDLSSQCRNLVVRIARPVIESYLADNLQVTLDKPMAFAAGTMANAGFANAWKIGLRSLIDQMSTCPQLYTNPRLRFLQTGSLVEMLLSNCQNSYSDNLALRQNDIAPRHVKRARDHIQANLHRAISITELAAAAHTSARSLQSGFHQFLGMSPVRYIRSQRLDALHQQLREAPSGATVTDIMLNCGVGSFGRYSQYYRDRYGVSPSDTLRRTGNRED